MTIVGVLIGLSIGLVAFGGGGFAAGRFTAPTNDKTNPRPTATASPSLGLYERTQLELNKPKFTGNLVAFGEPWLEAVSGCKNDKDRNGPKLKDGEAARVVCDLGNVSVVFVEYKTREERDKTTARVGVQNVDARKLAPGVREPAVNPEGLKGNYVEYAYSGAGDAAGQVTAGIWWDLAEQPVAGYIMASWTDGLGEKWEPLRDLWTRYH